MKLHVHSTQYSVHLTPGGLRGFSNHIASLVRIIVRYLFWFYFIVIHICTLYSMFTCTNNFVKLRFSASLGQRRLTNLTCRLLFKNMSKKHFFLLLINIDVCKRLLSPPRITFAYLYYCTVYIVCTKNLWFFTALLCFVLLIFVM